MIINKIAFGNNDEAFVEDRLMSGFNIIFSVDNNKGKTIVIQSAMYALGNDPIFPASFPYKNYYHYVQITLDDGSILKCCRYRDDFYVKHNESYYLLNEVSELKRCFSKIGFSFPTIIKDGRERIVDPVLFYQLFFVGQDDNKTSNILKNGFYNKDDFLEMFYSLKGIESLPTNNIDKTDLKKELDFLREKKKAILKNTKVLKKTNRASAVTSLSIDKERIEEIKTKTEQLTNKIITLSKERNRFVNKYNNSKAVFDQLSSLMIGINGTKLKCLDCGSTKIELVSDTEGFNFDISDDITRNDIKNTIKSKMDSYSEEIEKRTIEINELQDSIQSLLNENNSVTYEDIIYYAYQISPDKDYDKELLEVEKQIENLQFKISANIEKTNSTNELKAEAKKELVDLMNYVNKKIDPSSNNRLDVFTKQDVTYSGCEEAIYYLSRLYSLKVCLRHNYPIIMDHFRAGELSSNKENIVLDLFKEISNQVIFTVTLKNEENNKYVGINKINAINYETNESNHILSTRHIQDFLQIMSELKVVIKIS